MIAPPLVQSPPSSHQSTLTLSLSLSPCRREVLKAWSALAESGCVPLPLWPQLVQSAAGRLEDSSVMVVKVCVCV